MNAVFFNWFPVLFVKKSTFEICKKNMDMSAAILCPAVCISDVTNGASMCGKWIKHIMGQPFSALPR